MIDLSALTVSAPASYAVAVALPALDALIPVLPSETALIALGVATAGSTDPRIAVLIALAAAGAFIGDNLAYLLGRRYGARAVRRFLSAEWGARRRAWAEQALHRFGGRLIIASRFVPGGRTAVTLTCGMVGYPRRSFVAATAGAAVIWAGHAFFVGRLGGRVFAEKPWAGLLLGLAAALVISAVVEALRRPGLRQRLGKASRRPAGSWPAESAAGTQSGSAPAPSTRTDLTTGRRGEDS
jgi:membrane-associated protein